MYRKSVSAFFALIATAFVVTACSKDEEAVVDNYDPARDYFTFANTDQFVTEHLALDLDVDFEAQELQGFAMLTMRRAGCGSITGDTRYTRPDHCQRGCPAVGNLRAGGISFRRKSRDTRYTTCY